MSSRLSRRAPSHGFSLIELITVMAIIVIMAAVLLPPLANYVRLYRIRAATQQVAGAISAARMKAISKNVQLGVTFAVVNNSSYQVFVEDDQNPQTAPNWRTIAAEDWNVVIPDPAQTSPAELLPLRIEFVNPAGCQAPPGGVVATAADTWGLRFGRLGAGCGVSSTGCGGVPLNVPALTNYVDVAGTGLATLCLQQTGTAFRRWVNISPGGRVTTQP